MLRRRRSGCALASSNTPQLPTIVSTTHTPSSMPVILNVPVPITPGVSHRIRLVPHLDSRRSLRFDPITRDVVEGDPALRIGRFTERSGVPISQANALDSRPFELKDGDTLQLGVDYQGGTENKYKCVRIRVEIGREWQASANAFNTNALHHLKSSTTSIPPVPKTTDRKPPPKSSFTDCCICLFSVTIRQALFIAPCSHALHYQYAGRATMPAVMEM